MPCQRHASEGDQELMRNQKFGALLADKAFDVQWLIEPLQAQGVPIVSRKDPIDAGLCSLFWLLLGFSFWLPFLAVLLPPGPGRPGRWLSAPVHDLNVRGERADRDESQRRKPRPRPRFSLPRCEQALKPVWRPPSLARFAGPGATRRHWCRRPWPCRACRRLCRLLAGQRSSRVRLP